MSEEGNQPRPENRAAGAERAAAFGPAALVRTEAAALEALAARLEGPMAAAFDRALA